MSRSRLSIGPVYRMMTGLLWTFAHLRGDVDGHGRSLDDIQAYFGNTFVADAQNHGSAVGQVQNPAPRDRSAIINANHHRFVVLQIRNLDPRSEWKTTVSSRKVMHIIRFSARSLLVLEHSSVPRGLANLKPSGRNRLAGFLSLPWDTLVRVRCLVVIGCRTQAVTKSRITAAWLSTRSIKHLAS